MKNSDKKLPPQVQFNFMEDEEVDTNTNENNPNFVYSEEAEGNDLKELEFQEKPLINKKEKHQRPRPYLNRRKRNH